MRVRNKYISLRVTGEEKKLLYQKAGTFDGYGICNVSLYPKKESAIAGK